MPDRVPFRTRMTLSEALDVAVAHGGDRGVIVAGGREATAGQVHARACWLADELVGCGVDGGDHVALLLPNGVAFAEAFFAVMRAGAIAVPLDPRSSRQELAAVAARYPFAAVLTEGEPPSGQLPDEPAVVTHHGGRWTIARDRPGAVPGARAAPAPTDTAAIFMTSGTTGEPTGVAHTHRTLMASLISFQRLHDNFFSGSVVERARTLAVLARRLGPRLLHAAGGQTWFAATPFRTISGHGLLVAALLLGHRLVTDAGFHPRRTLELLEAERVNILAATPSVVELLLRVPSLDRFDLSSLLVVGIGGAPVAGELVERTGERLKCAVTVGYGSTEVAGGVLVTRPEDPADVQRGTVGRPFPGVEVRVVDDDDHPVPAGVAGELACRRDDEPEAGWLRTGDLAVADPDGNITILGRRDDVIIHGGNNVNPLEVERTIEQLPAVARSAVVGVGRSSGYQQLWAFVVPEDPSRPPDATEIRRHCRQHLAPWKVPDRVHVTGELPTNEQGEVRRRHIAERAHELVRPAGGSQRSRT